MERCRTFRYQPRVRLRALELHDRANGDIPTHEIAAQLETEGFGAVSSNSLSRWIRQSPSRRAMQAAALGQRLRHEAEAAANGEKDATQRIATCAAQLADVLAVTAKRVTRELPKIELRTPEDICRVAICLRDLEIAKIESFRALAALRSLSEKTERAQETR